MVSALVGEDEALAVQAVEIRSLVSPAYGERVLSGVRPLPYAGL
jgi:hypothetical protein